ncbi:amidohydrolase family protein [Porifericola rhodea]|uniref:amidohydrolase family protein n=1 Tax=Porifericola rhodea TaxID=930972 RepID=UPI0026661529|nr:amidohydrolase family protein [Porifericola rhodea]WKN30186.1 amidohydrolase family protein [Porifericola rhodea]
MSTPYFYSYLCAFCYLLFSCGQGDKLPSSSPAGFSSRDSLSKNVRPYLSYDEDLIALTHAILVDGSGRTAQEEQTIIIDKGYFKEVGPTATVKIPSQAKVINLAGKTVVPGIVGVHNHLHMPGISFLGEAAAYLYLASGVTTIQTCGAASPYQELELAAQIKKGQIAGPEIINSAPYISGEGGNPNMIIPRNETHLRDTMQFWIDQGVRWFKVYRHTKAEDLKVVIDVAHRHQAKVTGHLCSITFAEASRLGIDGIEHGLNSTSDFRQGKTYNMCNGSHAYMDSLEVDSEAVKELQQLMIDSGVFITSTLSIYEASIPERAFADERSLIAMTPTLRASYRERRARLDQDEAKGQRLKRLHRIMAFERQFVQMGGLLSAGADAGRHILPGFGDQRNFELLVEAGFSTEEAIQIMTSNGAKVLERTDIGSVAPGKKADLLILDGDLRTEPSVIRYVEHVFKAGYAYSPKLLLKEVEGKIGPQ